MPLTRRRWLAGGFALAAAYASLGPSLTARAATSGSSPAPDPLSYGQSTFWTVDDSPPINAMQATIRSVLNKLHVIYPGVDGPLVEGFFPGSVYQSYDEQGHPPFSIYGRDTATVLPTARYIYGALAMRSVAEELLRLQYPDGSISATVSPGGAVDKATTTSDEETSCILVAAQAHQAAPDPRWLNAPIRGTAAIDRLNAAMSWVMSARFDTDSGLIKRAHTTDWGDVKWETDGDAVHMEPGDQWTVSIYDQAIGYSALRSLAGLNRDTGRAAQAQQWDQAADALQQATDAALWQDGPNHGFYRIHLHLAPDLIGHPYDEGAFVAIGNAAAIYYGLLTDGRIGRVLDALEAARQRSGAQKVGLTLDTAYPDWPHSRMAARVYQNGALWDWWAGRQVTAEFVAGYSGRARQHLETLADDWAANHPDVVREWESPWLGTAGLDNAYGGAAGAVGEAVIRGLFGVEIYGPDVFLTPRLGSQAGTIRVYEPSTDIYAAYRYTAQPGSVSCSYGTNSPHAVQLRLPANPAAKPVAHLDGTTRIPILTETVGQDSRALVIVPPGRHKVDLSGAP